MALGQATSPRSYYGLNEANYTAQAGKRRLFPKGDGKLPCFREVNFPCDTLLNDSMREPVGTPQPHTKKRGSRRLGWNWSR